MYVDITNCTIHGYVIHIVIYVYQQMLQLLGWAFDQKKMSFNSINMMSFCVVASNIWGEPKNVCAGF